MSGLVKVCMHWNARIGWHESEARTYQPDREKSFQQDYTATATFLVRRDSRQGARATAAAVKLAVPAVVTSLGGSVIVWP
jgi:siderophore synthetase component